MPCGAGVRSISKERKMSKTPEQIAEKEWSTTCGEQCWNDESKIIYLEGFIRDKGLFGEFAAYAAKAAEEENDSLGAAMEFAERRSQ